MVMVDRAKNGGFFFSQKLKKSKPRLKNGGSPSPVFNLAYFLKGASINHVALGFGRSPPPPVTLS